MLYVSVKIICRIFDVQIVYTYKNGATMTVFRFMPSCKVSFVLSRELSDGTYTVVLVISRYEKGKRLRISTDVFVKNKKHLTKKNTVSISDNDHVEKNKRLRTIENKIMAAWYKLREENETLPSVTTIEDVFLNAYGASKQSTKQGFFAVFDTFTNTKEKASTKSLYVATKNTILNYEERTGIKWSWQQCNKTGIDALLQWLKDENLSVNSINSYRQCLTAFLNDCLSKNIISDATYKNIEKKEKSMPKVRYLLTHEQFIQYAHLELKDEKQAFARDMFVFAAITGGQRIGDVCRIGKENILNDVWRFTQEKTSAQIEIPLIDKALQILEKRNYFNTLRKYKDKPYSAYRNDLKESFRLLGLTQSVTNKDGEIVPQYETIAFHDARALFSTFSQEYGISDNLTASFTGHAIGNQLGTYQKTSLKTKLEILNKIFVGL